MKFFEAVANVFRIPDLRKRLLFALALLAVYRLGGHIPTPGIDTNQLADFFKQNQGTLFGFLDLFSGGMLPPADHFRAGHHALHHGVDHSAIVDGGGADARKAAERRRTRTAQDHPVDPLSDGRSWR